MASELVSAQCSRYSYFANYSVAMALGSYFEFRFQFLMIDACTNSRAHDRTDLYWISCCKVTFERRGHLRSPPDFVGCCFVDDRNSFVV